MALAIHQLTKAYVAPDGGRLPVIDVDSFRLADGEQAALIGSSGSGKSTLLHLIAGILVPDGGQILFDGPSDAPAPGGAGAAGTSSTAAAAATDVARLSEPERDAFRGRAIGYVFQTHHLLPGFTALENVLLGMSFAGRRPDPAWARRLLSEVGLAERLHFKPDRLSVGQQQRVAVARALANRPRLVLADEPTGALDPRTAQQVLALIRNLCTEVGASLLLVSHDLAIANQLPRVLSLSDLNRASAKPAEPAPQPA